MPQITSDNALQDRSRLNWESRGEAAVGVELPPRYAENWRDAFLAAARPGLVNGAQILDVGSGSRPVLAPDERPGSSHYAGLDLSLGELKAAPAGYYDEMIESDITRHVTHLAGRFTLALSWQVFEHVKDLALGVEQIHGYLRPGGHLVALTSGRNSLFGLANIVVPSKAAPAILGFLTQRPRQTIFPAYYDRCTHSDLCAVFSGWSSVQVLPKFRGASYFRRIGVAQRAYLAYESWAAESGRRNLASHYLIVASK